ncbi:MULTISPECIES: hypothetical protein [unclassified Streptomyces]|uniref:hypothetical protein n=1 Tax=Streptomyces sp. NPDC127129 TaxID=3345373 RepID=UPI003630A26A
MLDPQEPQDPLREMFRQAAASGQSRSRAVPVARIAERARHAHRRRLAVAAGAACLLFAGGGVTAAALLSDGPAPVVPANSPSPSPSPPAEPPSPVETTLPPPTGSTSPTTSTGTSTSTSTGIPGDPSASATWPSGRTTTSPP